MIPDNLDIFLISEIFESYLNKQDSNNWELSKKFAKINNEKDFEKTYKRIKERMRKYCCHGLFYINKNGDGKSIFYMDLNKVKIIKTKCVDGIKKGVWFRI